MGSRALGIRLNAYLDDHQRKLNSKRFKEKIKIEAGKFNNEPEALVLDKLPFISPEMEEEREITLERLQYEIFLASVSHSQP